MLVVRYGTDPDFTSTYSYDAEKGTYNRMVKGILTVDKSNEKPVELSNILIFETAHRTIDNVGRQSVDIESGGKGMLFHAGIVKGNRVEKYRRNPDTDGKRCSGKTRSG